MMIGLGFGLMVLLQVGVATANGKKDVPYIQEGWLRPEHRGIVRAHGSRLSKAGSERITFVGSLARTIGGKADTATVRLTFEFPGSFRMDDSNGKQLLSYDGSNPTSKSAAYAKSDSDLLEAFVVDSVDSFLSGQLNGVTALGEQGLTALSGGYAVAAPAKSYRLAHVLSGAVGSRARKTYCFRGDNQLLERVITVALDNKGQPTTETVYDKWTVVNGQMLPYSIVRVENGIAVFSFVAKDVSVSQALEDNEFKQ